MNKTKNLKVVALILLASAILMAAIPLPNVAAATQDSMYVYNSIGGTVSTGGKDLTGGESYNYDDGSTVTFTAKPDSGYRFLGWEVITASNQTTSTTNPIPFTFTESCALQALFIPTTNATQTTSTTGTSTVVIMNSAGGTTEPAAGTYDTYHIGTVNTFNAVPGNGFKFLYWMVATSTSTTYTSSSISYTISGNICAIQAYFVPTSSTLSVATQTPAPTVPEYSGAATIIIAVALVAVAFGTYSYKRKAKK